MKPKFKVEFLEEALAFLDAQEPKAREKIIYNIRKAQVTNDNDLFKKLTENIWEFRTLYKRTHYRFFAFWDKTDKTKVVVISTHGLIKKTGKTPKGEIAKAENLMELFFKNK